MNLEKTRCKPVPPGCAPGGCGADELSFLPGGLGSTALQPCCSARWLHAVPAVPSPPLQHQATWFRPGLLLNAGDAKKQTVAQTANELIRGFTARTKPFG